ncbi:hypothetical protein PMIN03_000800 [Paraphaeosphaeria minitans]
MFNLLESICYPPPVEAFARFDRMTLSENLWFCEILRQPHNEPAPRQLLWPEVPTSWIPLDASATLWNQLIRKLGVPEGATKEGLRFEEIDSIEDRAELRKKYDDIHALIIALQMSEKLNMKQRGKPSRTRHSVPFFEQTIDGACGFYSILHALSHGPPASMLGL